MKFSDKQKVISKEKAIEYLKEIEAYCEANQIDDEEVYDLRIYIERCDRL